jgi:asparagine synthase (glutamine-hydrolysing)
VDVSLDYQSLFFYFQLNYIPAPLSIISGVKKLPPAHCLVISGTEVKIKRYYRLPVTQTPAPESLDSCMAEVKSRLTRSVERRLVADVPVGCFLSGGLDSSIIAGLASRIAPDLNTFSIGYRDEPFFDESEFANRTARHFNTRHSVFYLTRHDLYEHLQRVLDHLDEPFADSSALPVYILSKETRRLATVALSGDGADEIFGGYNKHRAFIRALNPGPVEYVTYLLGGIWKFLPKSRNDFFGNKIRQLQRFAEGFPLDPAGRYWHWASISKTPEVIRLLEPCKERLPVPHTRQKNKDEWLQGLNNTFNSVLRTDLEFMLPNDMLYKVDAMSMAHGLEVRVPFLDHELVEYASRLPARFMYHKGMGKYILRETFRDMLPPGIIRRPKKGFEVPLLKWFRTELRSRLHEDWLHEEFIREQNLFNPAEIHQLKKSLDSRSPGDVHARLWALIVFQSWWKKYLA